MNIDIIEALYIVIILLFVGLVIAAVIFIGWYLLLLLLIAGTVGGIAYGCYQIFEIWKKAHKFIH